MLQRQRPNWLVVLFLASCLSLGLALGLLGCSGYVSGHFGASWPVGEPVPPIEHREGVP